MHLQQRIDLLVELGNYMSSENEAWMAAKQKASYENGWFLAEFIELATANIVNSFLQREKLEPWAKKYDLPEEKRPC